MSFWEDLDPNIRRYIVVAGLLVLALIAFRACGGVESAAEPPPRGIQQ